MSKARLQVTRTNVGNGISKEEQNSVYRIGKCKHTNARKAETKVLSSKYRGVFAKLSWVNNEHFNSKTALLKSGEILNLIITPANEDAAVTFAENNRASNGEKLAFVVEKQTRPVNGSINGEVLETTNIKCANERIVKSEIGKDPKFASYTGNWQNLPFNAGTYKTAENGQTIIVLKCLGKVEDSNE